MHPSQPVFMSLLTGDALRWATVIWENSTEEFTSYDQVISMFRRVFDHAPEEKKGSERTFAVRQSKHRAATYSLEFRTLVMESGWNELALKAVFRQGLNENIHTEMAWQP